MRCAARRVAAAVVIKTSQYQHIKALHPTAHSFAPTPIVSNFNFPLFTTSRNKHLSLARQSFCRRELTQKTGEPTGLNADLRFRLRA